MKYINTILILILTSIGSASDIEYTVTERFDPPILFNAEGFKSEIPEKEWTTAFLSLRAPIKVTFEEFTASISETVKDKYALDEAKFQAMVSKTPKGKPYESILAEVKFSQMKEDFLMLITYPSALEEYPKSRSEADGFVAKHFFKKVDSSWISWKFPHDMPFDDPMGNIDYMEVLWPTE